MNAIDSARAQVEMADGVGPVFGAAWDAFDLISLVADRYAEKVTSWFVTWMALIPPACEGRDAVGFAPSVPPCGGTATDLGDLTQAPEDNALHALAELAAACAVKLSDAAADAVSGADASAAARALVAAEEIRGILRESS